MAIDPLSAVNASTSTSGPSGIGAFKAAAPQHGGENFLSILEGLASGAVAKLQTAEATSAAGLKGQASVQEVTFAVMEAERSMQTAIALRDKAVSAYLELSHMSI